MQKDVPESIQSVLIEKQFADFVDTMNEAVKWEDWGWDTCLITILCILVPSSALFFLVFNFSYFVSE